MTSFSPCGREEYRDLYRTLEYEGPDGWDDRISVKGAEGKFIKVKISYL